MNRYIIATLLFLGINFAPKAFSAEVNYHSKWGVLLKNYVKNGRVDYKNFDSKKLDLYLDDLSKIKVGNLQTNQKLALWINAYNAYTIKLILNNYPLKSIKDISSPWDKKFCEVGGKIYSLNQIEHEILRKQFKEPRIHFAIVCASIGCPKLASFAYDGDKINKQLESQTMAFFADSSNLKIDKSFFGNEKIYTSKIISWFGEDFGANKKERIQFIDKYAPEKIKSFITSNTIVDLSFISYDWDLNDQKIP